MGLAIDKNQIFVAGALICAILLHNYSAEDAEYGSEVLCWILLFAWSLWRRAEQSQADNGSIGISPWITALGLGLASLAKYLGYVEWITPALAPILSIIQRYSSPYDSLKKPTFAFNLNTLPCQVGVSVFTLLILLPSIDITIPSASEALLYLLACVVIFTMLTVMSESLRQREGPLDGSNYVAIIRLVALRALPLLLIASVATTLQHQSLNDISTDGIEIVVLGILKAMQWIFLFCMTQDIPWDIVAPILTFAIASDVPSAESESPWLLIGSVLASLAALGQVIAFIPSASKSKLSIFAFILIPVFTVISTSSMAEDSFIAEYGNSLADMLHHESHNTTQHPIEQLIRKSQADFSSMLERQSKTLKQAEAEYRRRYDMEPPAGFDKWFEFASSIHSPLIDEFDTIYESFAPFWKIPPAAIRKAIKQTAKQDKHIFKCRVQDGQWKGWCGWDGKDIETIMAPIAHQLPDFEFLLSNADGPRVFMSEDVEEASQDVKFKNRGGKNIWDLVSEPCQYQNRTLPIPPRKSNASNEEIYKHGLPFIHDAKESKDICSHPEYKDKHAFFMSPADAIFTKQAAPILTQSKGSTNNDILYPSAFYFSTARGGSYDPTKDPDWDEKPNDKLYWAGSNTGGVNKDGLWHNFQRQRFVSRANYLDEPLATFLNKSETGDWQSYETDEQKDLFDVKFTAYIQCNPGSECRKHEKKFGRHKREGRKTMYRHKLAADLDGNGYSGRWYKILRSNMTPFKQTIWHEWHDDRLYPWVHYIPMSIPLDELPETVRYLSQDKQGKKHAKEIARQSREWFHQAFDWGAFQVYFYRLALEYARLLDDDRVVKT